MITRQQLEIFERAYYDLRDASTTLDEAIAEPHYSLKQAAWDALQRARVEFITHPVKTPQIEELPVCPLCGKGQATESMSDYLFGVTVKEEMGIEHERICKTCHDDLTERYPEPTREEIVNRNVERGFAWVHYPDKKDDMFDWMYDGGIEPDSQQQTAQDIRSQLGDAS